MRALTGFDRVMVYRFDAEWNGEVVAEDRRPDLEPFLGLHYPASDIPAQARDAVRHQLDADHPRRAVHAGAAGAGREPAAPARRLDLSGAMLRSVSPVHLEYLANMGVVASMSVSLIDRGELWGLIACHHYAGAAPARPTPTGRPRSSWAARRRCCCGRR